MGRVLIEQFDELALEDEVRTRLGLPGSALRLRRAWPRSTDHIVFEFVDNSARIVPGQWLEDSSQLQRIAEQTARQCPDAPPAIHKKAGVLLQPGGCDRRLTGLPFLVGRPEATLIAHRPERRAVVKLDGKTGTRFAKVLRQSQLGNMVRHARFLAALCGRPFRVPEVLEVDPPRGVVIWSSLPGVSVHELLDDRRRLLPAVRAAGVALRWLHSIESAWNTTHDARAETDMLRERLEQLEVLNPHAYRDLENVASPVFDGLAAEPARSGLLHRDFYDKQIFAHSDGRIGLLDFDTLAVGETALDLANMLVHLELRTLQGRSHPDLAAQASAAFLDGYNPEPEVRGRLSAYCDASRFRLACLYAFRPRWRHLVRELAQLVGAPPLTLPDTTRFARGTRT